MVPSGCTSRLTLILLSRRHLTSDIHHVILRPLCLPLCRPYSPFCLAGQSLISSPPPLSWKMPTSRSPPPPPPPRPPPSPHLPPRQQLSRGGRSSLRLARGRANEARQCFKPSSPAASLHWTRGQGRETCRRRCASTCCPPSLASQPSLGCSLSCPPGSASSKW